VRDVADLGTHGGEHGGCVGVRALLDG
jgi:hypothetical protein